MADKIADLFVEVSAKTDKLQRDLNKVKAKSKAAGKQMGGISFKGAAIAAGVAVVATKLFQLGVAAKDAARDAEETRSKFFQVFSGIQKEADNMAQEFAASFGLAESSAQKLLGNTGDLLVGFGFTESAALDLSNQVNSLALDLASFQNVSSERASDALTKALLGETESAKGLGIVIRQNTQEFRDNVKSISETQGVTLQQAKSIEILRIATLQSSKAIGDFARTQDSLANQEKILNEEIKQLNEEVGAALIPIFQSATSVAIDFFRSLTESDLETTIRQLRELGVAAEDLQALKEIDIRLKAEERFEDATNALEAFRENLDVGGVFNTFFATPNIAKIISGTEKRFKELKKVIEDATDIDIPVTERFRAVNEEIENVKLQAIALAKEIGKKGTSDELEKQAALYNKQLNFLSRILGSLADIRGAEIDISDEAGKVSKEYDKRVGIIKDVTKLQKISTELLEEETKKQEKFTEGSLAFENQQLRINEAQRIFNSLVEATPEPDPPSKFLKATVGILDEFRDKIKELNTALATETDIEKQVILTASIEQLQEDLLDKEVELKLKFVTPTDEELFDAGDLDTGAIEKQMAEDFRAQEQLQLEHEEKMRAIREAAKQEFISTLGVENEEAFALAQEVLDAELQQVIDAEGNVEQAKLVHNAKMADLDGARLAASLANASALANALGTASSAFPQHTAAYKALAFTEATIAGLLAVQKALGSAPPPLNFIAAAAVGVATSANLASILDAHGGGTFENGKKIASFAGGGDFIVPSGFPNDSFPLRVESGERVTVTPRNQIAAGEEGLNKLGNKIDATNRNLALVISAIGKQKLDVNIDGKSFVKRGTQHATNRLQKAGVDLSLL